jgi:hypothetical protein
VYLSLRVEVKRMIWKVVSTYTPIILCLNDPTTNSKKEKDRTPKKIFSIIAIFA